MASMKFETLRNFVALVARKASKSELLAEIDNMLAPIPEWTSAPRADFIGPIRKRSHWHRDLRKLADFIVSGDPQFSIFAADGNGKLPFLAFSALPGREFCPGAGECLQFCYSFRAWRYPAAFCRQVQNTMLLNSIAGQDKITEALDIEAAKISGEYIDFRLYVDGDFRNVYDIDFWMSTLATRPRLRVYGYSKSWSELVEYSTIPGRSFPDNYLLNLSSGSIHGLRMFNRVSKLHIARGEFIAVNVGYPVKSNMHGEASHNKNLREAFRKTGDTRKAFTCPGKCGDCTPKGHACGSERFRNIPVIIAVH